MRISQERLKRFSQEPLPLPPPVEPRLALAEEVVLLSPDAPRRVLRHVTRVAGRAYRDGPRGHHAAVASLEARGLLAHGAATPAAQLGARRARVHATIHRAAPPAARDAELLMLLAAAGSLPIAGRSEHLYARTRLGSIVAAAPLPPAVAGLAEELALEPADLPECLLPGPRNLTNVQAPPGVWLS